MNMYGPISNGYSGRRPRGSSEQNRINNTTANPSSMPSNTPIQHSSPERIIIGREHAKMSEINNSLPTTVGQNTTTVRTISHGQIRGTIRTIQTRDDTRHSFRIPVLDDLGSTVRTVQVCN